MSGYGDIEDLRFFKFYSIFSLNSVYNIILLNISYCSKVIINTKNPFLFKNSYLFLDTLSASNDLEGMYQVADQPVCSS